MALIRTEVKHSVQIVHFPEGIMLGIDNVHDITEELNEFIDAQEHIRLLFNFTEVNYISSAVLGTLVALKRRVDGAEGRMKICNIRPKIMEVFKISRLDEVFEIYPDEHAAIEAFGPHKGEF